MNKYLIAMQEAQVLSLGLEDPLEKEMATTSVFLPEELRDSRSQVGYRPWGHRVTRTLEWVAISSSNA